MEIDNDTQYKLDSNLELFMNNNDRKKVYELVEQGANPSRPLFYAIEKGDFALAELCVEQGGNVNQERWGTTALVQAIKFGQGDIANLLLDNGANPKAHESEALSQAAVKDHFDLLDRMLNLGADAKEQEQWILRAASKHSLDKLKHYEDMGLDIHYNGNNLLQHATCCCSIETMDYLINKGQAIQDRENYDCLQTAAEHGHLEKVEFLLSKGADPNLSRETLNIPIMHKHNDVVKALIEAGADPTANIDDALYEAVSVANYEIIDYLLIDRKMPVSDFSRQWLQDSNEPAKYANQVLQKRELNERLQQKYQRPPTQAKTKSQSLKI